MQGKGTIAFFVRLACNETCCIARAYTNTSVIYRDLFPATQQKALNTGIYR